MFIGMPGGHRKQSQRLQIVSVCLFSFSSSSSSVSDRLFLVCVFSLFFFLLLFQTGGQSSSGFRWGSTVSSLASSYTFMFSATIPGRVQAFSSYPGRLMSGDDYYLLSSGLVSGGRGVEGGERQIGVDKDVEEGGDGGGGEWGGGR